MGSFWRVSDHPELKQVWFSPIADPANVQEGDAVWLETAPKGTALPDGSIAVAYAGAQPSQPLAWVTAPPATGTVGQDITATFKDGVAPYTFEVKSATIVLNNGTLNAGDPKTITVNADGTNQPAGTYGWTVTDATGAKIIGSTVIHAAAAPLAFTTNLPAAALNVYSDAPGSLTVAVTGGTPPYKYQWDKAGVDIGPDAPVYPLPVNLGIAQAVYGCEVSDSSTPKQTINSNRQHVNTWAHLSISQQPPATYEYAVGDTIQITAGASGGMNGARNPTWYKNGVATGQKNNTLNIPNAAATQVGEWFCRYSDGVETLDTNHVTISLKP